MAQTDRISQAVLLDMENKKVDIGLTLEILENFNRGRYADVEPVRVTKLPEVDGSTIVDLTGDLRLRVPLEAAVERIASIDRTIDILKAGTREGDCIVFDRRGLSELGLLLFPFVAYGVLNGGSATSYIDSIKNRAFSPDLFALLRDDFERVAENSGGKPKGITPAFVNPDGTPGPSFLLLKMRSLLTTALEYTARTGKPFPDENLFFQMTSEQSHDQVMEAYRDYRTDPLIEPLVRATGVDITRVETGVQKLIAAYTHSSEGLPKRLFTRAFGEEGKTLPLPGGHGQNFTVLRDVYRRLHANGKRFACLGNVDNIGFTVDPVEVAMLALTGKSAGFDFSFRTPVDVKGGVLVVDQRGRLNAADIGPAISEAEVARAEAEGGAVMFNCATGLFDLDYLTTNIDYITRNLPMRWSDQDKDAGKYSQAEQVTWEVIGMLDDFLVFGIDKYERFLSAKLLMETLMTSGILLDDPRYPGGEAGAAGLRAIAGNLHRGLVRKLTSIGMKRSGGRWIALDTAELGRTGRA